MQITVTFQTEVPDETSQEHIQEWLEYWAVDPIPPHPLSSDNPLRDTDLIGSNVSYVV